MLQQVITITIVAAAFLYVSHRIYKTLTAEKPQCSGCEFGKNCNGKCDMHLKAKKS
ncbi:MAG: hypothetical protein J6P49_01935 [Paludibacteraceae bacterium]|nr:hypothetical protein [Paludibacteraceae bacterium]MBP5136516.1 hypothetical protein [Paludibacteraceae bacterium]MBP5742960.1 hypothetical protein [Paludibacteraceae bacterium]